MSTEPRTVVKMPVQRFHLDLSEIGYDGWWIELRINPRSDMYDQWFSEDEKKVWEAFGYLIVDWNWGDEDGNPLPKPPELVRESLPIHLLPFIYRKYVEALREAAGLPKAPPVNSNDTLQTEDAPETVDVVESASTPEDSTTQKTEPVQPVLITSTSS